MQATQEMLDAGYKVVMSLAEENGAGLFVNMVSQEDAEVAIARIYAAMRSLEPTSK